MRTWAALDVLSGLLKKKIDTGGWEEDVGVVGLERVGRVGAI